MFFLQDVIYSVCVLCIHCTRGGTLALCHVRIVCFHDSTCSKYILLVHVIYSYGQDRMDSMGLSTQTSQFTMIMANELFVMGA